MTAKLPAMHAGHSEPVGFTLTLADKYRLHDHARATHQSLSDVVRRAVADYLSTDPGTPEAIPRRTLSHVVRFETAPRLALREHAWSRRTSTSLVIAHAVRRYLDRLDPHADIL